jgi:hypothetical protein
MHKIIEDERMMRRIVLCAWRCRRCRAIFGSENVAFYGTRLPDSPRPTWFFAAMALLDHLRDCAATDFSQELRSRFGKDFLNHPNIHEWFSIHAMVESRLVAQEEL